MVVVHLRKKYSGRPGGLMKNFTAAVDLRYMPLGVRQPDLWTMFLDMLIHKLRCPGHEDGILHKIHLAYRSGNNRYLERSNTNARAGHDGTVTGKHTVTIEMFFPATSACKEPHQSGKVMYTCQNGLRPGPLKGMCLILPKHSFPDGLNFSKTTGCTFTSSSHGKKSKAIPSVYSHGGYARGMMSGSSNRVPLCSI